jgi:hypothetical protein
MKEMRNAKVFWLEDLKGRDYLEDLGVDGKIKLERILEEIRWEIVDWLHLTSDRIYFRAFVETVINLRVP